MNPLLFTSKSTNWRTPPELFRAIEALDPRQRFTVDAAADAQSALCNAFLGPGSAQAEDALHPDVYWGGGNDRVWLNPPYGRELAKFVAKAVEEIVECPGMSVWMLVPARTDTRWWNELMPYASDIWFIRGRVYFIDTRWSQVAENPAPFPAAVVVISCGTGFRRGPTVRFGWTY